MLRLKMWAWDCLAHSLLVQTDPMALGEPRFPVTVSLMGGGAVYNFSHSPKKLHAKTV